MRTFAGITNLLGFSTQYPEFLSGQPETETVLEVKGVKFAAFLSRPEARPGARLPLFIALENAHNTSRLISFAIDAPPPAPQADTDLSFKPRLSADLKDGEAGLIVVPLLVSSDAPPGPRRVQLSARVSYEHLGQRTRNRPRRGAVSCRPDSPYCLDFEVTPAPAAASRPPEQRQDFSYYELWNIRDLPGPKTIVDQVWNSIRLIISKES